MLDGLIQIASPYDIVPVRAYGGVGRVVGLLASTVPELLTIAAPGSSGANVRPAPHATADSLVDTALRAHPDRVLVHDRITTRRAIEVLGSDRVIEMLHMPLSDDDADELAASGHRVLAVSASQALPLRQRGLTPPVVWHATPLAPPGPGDGGYLAWVGRFTPQKGPLDALAAARLADLPLLLLASATNPFEEEYFELVREHLHPCDQVVLSPESSVRDSLLARATATLVPTSGPEAFGLVAIESAMVATPIIGYPNFATAEILETGIGLPAHDPTELATRVGELAHAGPARSAVAKLARELFSPAAWLARLAPVLEP